ncbi:MAG: acyl-CoA dehydrogenase family protein, partial [Acidimicrobiales bacterium]
MHVEFTDEQQALRTLVRDFAEGEIAPHAARWDAEHTFPTDVVLQMGGLGLFGIPFPEEYGGGGADLTTLCIAIEELGRVDQSLAITLEAGVGLGANPIYRFGTEAQRQQWLPDLCAGRALGGFGLTEPDAGSDAGGTRTTARLEGADGAAGGEWVIDGEKAFITNSGTDITSL